ncbi:MAG: hypothetical protein KA746_10615 [Pyrinomonadaceae bacterium]|nr:hypothetical protein [Pyrinomonadaceae bacterium]MBP6212256.1 hypothetical protein [Pyrinomonadaceae bacterium]
MKKLLIACAVTFVMSFAAIAQNTPADVSDLVGIKASSGESELRSRGYRFVKTEKGGDSSYSNWWRSNTKTCISVRTFNGRYDTIVSVVSADCNQYSGGNNGGNWGGNNGDQVSPPSWARGTFYGTGPGGEQITLTINNNGSVTASVNGSMSYGSFARGNYLNLGGATSSVTRNGSGITTTRTDNGERISYSKNSWNNGNNGGNWNNGNNSGGQISPPSWARGTFYGTGPGGEQITLTISNNGSVTASVNGSPSYGSFTRGNYLNLGGATSSVTRNGSGITTTRTDNGERISYSKNSWGSGNNGGGYVNVNDLIGTRASSGESELQNRGFRNTRGYKSSGNSYTIWWNGNVSQCIRVTTRDGRYSDIISTNDYSCR